MKWRCGKDEEINSTTNNSNNISQPVVQSKLPLCKKNLAALVTNNENHNNFQNKLQTILEEPDIQPKEGYLDKAESSHFITTTCPGKTVTHKPMQVSCENITTMDSIATK